MFLLIHLPHHQLQFKNMKVKIIPSIISLILGLIITSFMQTDLTESLNILLFITRSLCLSSALIFILGISHTQNRTAINIRATSGLFFTLILLLNLATAWLQFSFKTTILLNSFLFVSLLSVIYFLNEKPQ